MELKSVSDYCYEGTSVLINKYNIRDPKILSYVESNLTSFHLKKYYKDNSKFEMSIESLKATHKYMFEDLYEFAGETRECNMSKKQDILGGRSVNYVDVPDLIRKGENIFSRINSYPFETVDEDTKLKIFSRYMADVWKIHFFREGNTRTTFALFVKFGQKIGLDINVDYIEANAKQFRNALVLANAPTYSLMDIRPLDNLIKESITAEDSNNYVEVCASGYENVKKISNGKNVYLTLKEYPEFTFAIKHKGTLAEKIESFSVLKVNENKSYTYIENCASQLPTKTGEGLKEFLDIKVKTQNDIKYTTNQM